MTREAVPDLLVHVGGFKCGSSTLQSHLTAHPEGLLRPGTPFGEARYAYVAVGADHDRIGADLASFRHAGYWRYQVSVGAGALDSIGDERVARLRDRLRDLIDQGIVPILSNEGYFRAPAALHRLLSRLGMRAHAVLVVRPQARLVNSGWWQWGLWQESPLTEFVTEMTRTVQWHARVSELMQSPEIPSVEARLLRPSLVEDLVAVSPGEPVVRVNEGLPLIAIKALRSQGKLRGPHTSQYDFVLSRWLDLAVHSRESRWVLAPHVVEQIIDSSRDDNLRLAQYLRAEDLVDFAADEDWWSTTPYADLEVTEPAPEVTVTDYALITHLLLEGLLRADREVQQAWGRRA